MLQKGAGHCTSDRGRPLKRRGEFLATRDPLRWEGDRSKYRLALLRFLEDAGVDVGLRVLRGLRGL